MMSRTLSLLGVLLWGAGCRARPDAAFAVPSAVSDPSLRLRVLNVYEGQDGYDVAGLQGALASRLKELGFADASVYQVHEPPAGEWTPARACLAAREGGGDAALTVAIFPSEIPIHPRDPEGDFLFRNPFLGTAPPPGRWMIVRVRIFDARTLQVVYESQAERREATRPGPLARMLPAPLEEAGFRGER